MLPRRTAASILAALLLASCRQSPLSPDPVATAPPGHQAYADPLQVSDHRPTVPTISNLEAQVAENGDLLFTGDLDPVFPYIDQQVRPCFYAEIEINTDQRPTGAGWGFDYVVRGSEIDWDANSQCVVRDALGSKTGEAGFGFFGDHFYFRVYGASIGNDDGAVAYHFHLYAVPGPGQRVYVGKVGAALTAQAERPRD